MNAPVSGPQPAGRDPKRHAGPRVVLVGFLIIVAIATFIVTRIVQTSSPAPDPDSIPERPSGEAPG